MKIKFFPNEKGRPANLIANCEVSLDGSFEGLKIAGISLWHGKEGGVHATLPAREYTDKEGKKAYYDFVRSEGKEPGPIKRLKTEILRAWERENEPAPF